GPGQGLLVREMVVERALRDPGALADLVKGGGAVAVAAEESPGRVDERSAGVRGVVGAPAVDHTGSMLDDHQYVQRAALGCGSSGAGDRRIGRLGRSDRAA